MSGKHGGSALQGLGWSACVPKNSSLHKGQALHTFCMRSSPWSVEDSTRPYVRARLAQPLKRYLFLHPLHRGSVNYCLPCPQLFPTPNARTFVAVSCFSVPNFRVQSRLTMIFSLAQNLFRALKIIIGNVQVPCTALLESMNCANLARTYGILIFQSPFPGYSC